MLDWVSVFNQVWPVHQSARTRALLGENSSHFYAINAVFVEELYKYINIEAQIQEPHSRDKSKLSLCAR